MKRICLLTLLFLATLCSNQAQKFYAGFQKGFGYDSFGKDQKVYSFHHITYEDNHTEDSKTSETYTYTLGEGKSYSIFIGYSAFKFLSFEFETRYLKSNPVKFRYVDNYDLNYNPAFFLHFTYNVERKGTSISFAPIVKYHPFAWKVQPYLKAGLEYSICKIVDNAEMRLFNTIPTYTGYEHMQTIQEIDPVKSFHPIVGLGLEYKLLKTLSLSLDFQAMKFTIEPVSGKVTNAIVNDENVMEQLTTNQKEFIFTDMPQSETQENEPAQVQTQIISFGNTSLNLSLKFTLIKKERKDPL